MDVDSLQDTLEDEKKQAKSVRKTSSKQRALETTELIDSIEADPKHGINKLIKLLQQHMATELSQNTQSMTAKSIISVDGHAKLCKSINQLLADGEL